MASSNRQRITRAVIVLVLGSAAVAPVRAFDPGPPLVVSRNQDGDIGGWPCLGVFLARDNPRWLSLSCLFPLVPGENNGVDSYLVDRDIGLVERVSVTSDGQDVDYPSGAGLPSPDGRYVVFGSAGPLHPDAGEFGPGTPEPGYLNVFLRDRLAGTTELISRDSEGNARPGQSFVLRDVLHSRQEFIMQSNIRMLEPHSPGVPPEHENLYARNWRTGAIEVISIGADGMLANNQSLQASYGGDGRYVVFSSRATNLPDAATAVSENLFLRDRASGTTIRLTRPWHGGEFMAGASPVASGTRPRLSQDSRYVLFGSGNRELLNDHLDPKLSVAHLYLIDRESNTIIRLSTDIDGNPGNHSSSAADMSDDGRYIAFYSQATNLPAGRRAIYVIDRQSGEWLTVTSELGGHLGAAPFIDLASDGSVIAFTWRSDDASQPDLYDRLLVYTIDLGIEPAGPGASPQPVPTGSRTAWLLLIVVFLFATFRASRDLKPMNSR